MSVLVALVLALPAPEPPPSQFECDLVEGCLVCSGEDDQVGGDPAELCLGCWRWVADDELVDHACWSRESDG